MRVTGSCSRLFISISFILFFLIAGNTAAWEIEITDPVDSEAVSGVMTIKGTVTEDLMNDTGEVSNVNISIDNGVQYIVDADGPQFSTWHFDWDTTKVGNGDTTVTAHLVIREETGPGGGNESRYDYWEEDPFTITVAVNNTKPLAEIASPADSSIVEFGDLVHFEATVVPGPGRTIVEYDWRSSADLAIGNASSFNLSSLSPGYHTIYLRATDDLGIESIPATVGISIVLPPDDQWPLFGRNLARNGLAPAGPNVTHVKWNYSIDLEGREFTPPVIHDWRVIIGENVDDGTGRYGILHAFDANGTHDGVDGTDHGRADILWNLTLPSPITAVPACRHTSVFVGTEWSPEDPTLFCIDIWTGIELWNASLGTVFGSPAVTEDFVIVASGDLRVRAFDPATGAQIWARRFDDLVMAPPLVVGGRVFVAAGDGHLHSLDVRSGSVLDSFDLGGFHTSAPIFDSDLVFMAARAETGNDDRIVARNRFNLWDSGEGAWAFTPGGRILASPVASNGTVIAVTEAGTVLALTTAGALIWELPLNDTVVSTPAIGGTYLYVPSETGALYVIDIDLHEVIWTSRFDGPLTSPALLGNVVVLGSGGEVLALWNLTMPDVEIASIAPADIADLPETETWYKVGIPQNPVTISEGMAIELVGEASDPDGYGITAWEWTSSLDGAIGNASAITVNLSRGSHTISVRAMNAKGVWSAWTTGRVSIFANSRPTVSLQTDRERVGEFTTFDLMGSSDLDGDIHLFTVDFGDGSGTDLWFDRNVILTHQYAYANNYGVRIIAYDDRGLASEEFTHFLTIMEAEDEEPDGDGAEEEGPLGGDIAFAVVGIVAVVLIILALAFFRTRKTGPHKGRKARMVEFEEEAAKPEVDEKEIALAEIQKRVSKDRRGKRPGRTGPRAARPRKAPPAGKGPAKVTGPGPKAREGRPARTPAPAKEAPAEKAAPQVPRPGAAPAKAPKAPRQAPERSKETAPPKTEERPSKPHGPAAKAEASGEAPKETKQTEGAAKRSSLEDLLKEIESMKK